MWIYFVRHGESEANLLNEISNRGLKHGLTERGRAQASALAETLRLELCGRPVRVIEIDPGMVETEFSVVRFAGDTERAAKVYEGLTPLAAGDIAECIAWAVTRPRHVNIDEIVVRPIAQATATQVARGVGL